MAKKIFEFEQEQPVATQDNYSLGLKEFSLKPWTTDQSFMSRKYGILVPEKIQNLYIYNINTKQEVKIDLVPDSIAESYSPRITSVRPFGVLRPINFYVGGGEKKISFSIELHEDIANINGSLYALIDRLKGMSLPVVSNESLKGPSVYIQFGTQFAGKGHIDTSVTYKLPYNVETGRYKAASVSLTFTFHEEFYETPTVVDESTLTTKLGVSVLPEVAWLNQDNDSIDDFLGLVLDYDYTTILEFADSKLNAFFNVITSDQVVKSFEANYFYKAEDIQKSLEESVSAFKDSPLTVTQPTADSVTTFYRNPYGVQLINSYKTLDTILNPIFSRQAIISNLKSLKVVLENLEKQYRASYFTNVTAALPGPNTSRDIGWYIDATNGFVFQMTVDERIAFEEALKFLVKVIDAQIFLNSITYGAGE